MELTLYRQWEQLPLGWHPTLQHDGIRDADWFENFENIAKGINDIKIKFSTNIYECDLVVFNLDRNNTYTILQPSLLVDPNIFAVCKDRNIPVVFWHVGECHSTDNELVRIFELRFSIKPWWVDSNARSNYIKHLFIDHSDQFWNVKLYKSTQMPIPEHNTNDFMLAVLRSDAHKHIIYNALKTYPNKKVQHFGEPEDIASKFRGTNPNTYDSKFDYQTVPEESPWLSDSELLQIKLNSSVLLPINTYFVTPECDAGTDPLYITEKFMLDLLTNKPVLPLGNHGTVNYLRQLGYEFPDWIDYSYDNYVDPNLRLEKFIKSVWDLLSVDNLSERSKDWQKNSLNRQIALNFNVKQQFRNICKAILKDTK
jgi:hypothetical protein